MEKTTNVNYSNKKVEKVRELYKEGYTKPEIAKKVHLTENQIQYIIYCYKGGISFRQFKKESNIKVKKIDVVIKSIFSQVCVVCGDQRKSSVFCNKHYYRYVIKLRKKKYVK